MHHASSNPFAGALALAIAAVVTLGAPEAQAQYPDRPLSLIVPYTPGGFTDALARAVARPLSERLKQAIVVQNVPGGGGNIGAARAAKSPPDGYTLYIGNNATITLNTLIYKSLPFDPLTELAPVALIGESQGTLVVPPSLGVKSVAELIALAKEKPGQLNFGSTGAGGVSHLSGEMFKLAQGVRMTHVPYKGTAPATADLLGGQLHLMFNDAAIPYIKAEKLRALAVTGMKRSTQVPDVPTFNELGITGYESYAWFGIFVPAGTPPAIVTRLSRELNAVTQDPAFQKWMQSQNGDARSSTPDELAVFIKKDLTKWGSVVKATGIVAE
jgi:tripartite-type tricarboxylate transporter receptor subunit TctC